MAPPSAIQFINAAFSCTTPFALSYADPKQKWLIQKHLLSLLHDFPALSPSSDTFIHDDGTAVNLLNASGYLQVSQSTPPIPLTIWLHENYPYMRPIIFISSSSAFPIHHDHPFVDPSGAITSPYLQTWEFPRCNLSDLVRNLVKVFSTYHPFSYSNSPISSFIHPSYVSKMEAIDRLTGKLHYDMMALQAGTEDEIEALSNLQVEMVKRVDITTSIILGLEHERMNLKGKVKDLMEDADVLMNWLKAYDPQSFVSMVGHEIEDAFAAVGEKSKLVLDCLAADKGIEDLLYALDKAIEQGAVTFEMYIRQVRILAREQFAHRDMIVKLKGPDILQ